MRILIALLVLVVGGLHVLDGQLVTFKSPQVQPLPQVPVPIDVPVIEGAVSDVQRFLLAVAAGWSAPDAIIATAISIAEDGSGNPAILSPANFDGSRDFCLLQVNSGWWSRFGGMQALADPATCFRAGFVIYGIQGWCAWSTYGTPAQCGRGHTNAYAAYLTRATVAAGR